MPTLFKDFLDRSKSALNGLVESESGGCKLESYKTESYKTESYNEEAKMSNQQKHRPGVKEIWLMVRRLRLEGPVSANHQLIVQEIDKLLGVDAVSIDTKENLLNVAYYASKRQLDEIEDIVRKYECDIADSWWTHVKEDYYKFVDKNVKDNANHEPWSCHKRPSAR